MKSSRKLGDFYYGVSVWRRGYELPQSDPVGFVAAIHMIGYPITSCIWPFLCVFLRISVLFPIGRESAWMPMRAGFIPQKVLIISVKAQSPEGSDKMKRALVRPPELPMFCTSYRVRYTLKWITALLGTSIAALLAAAALRRGSG